MSRYEKAEVRVPRGAAELDEKHPGWAYNIELGDLEMNDCDRCIAGQLARMYDLLPYDGADRYGQFTRTVAALLEVEPTRTLVTHLGFDIDVSDDFDEDLEVGFTDEDKDDNTYAQLAEEWGKQVRARTR